MDNEMHEVVAVRVQCCVCKRFRKGNQWVSEKAAPGSDKDVSHGYCPTCAANAFGEVAKLTARPMVTTHT